MICNEPTTQISIKSLVFGSVVAVGTGISVLTMASEAQALEQVRFTYNSVEVTVSDDDVERFAETGELPDDLRAFFDDTPQVPEDIRTVLTREFRIPRFVDSFLDSPTGEFALLQIDQAINSSSNRGDLDALRSAFAIAGADRDVSFLEILQVYPEDEVSVNVSNLEDVYTRTVTFVERIQPAIETAIGFLQDIVCDCAIDESAEADTVSEAGSSADDHHADCNPTHTDLVSTTHNDDVTADATHHSSTNPELSPLTGEAETTSNPSLPQ